jgi:hypothetical protein
MNNYITTCGKCGQVINPGKGHTCSGFVWSGDPPQDIVPTHVPYVGDRQFLDAITKDIGIIREDIKAILDRLERLEL